MSFPRRLSPWSPAVRPSRAARFATSIFPARGSPHSATARAPSSPEDIRRAYLQYLEHASKDDKSRIDALLRLAQLEFQLNEAQSRGAGNAGPDDGKDDNYYASVDRNIELLQILLHDHPDAAGADKTLYQLARAYDQRGLNDKSMEALERLARNFPKSAHYVESKFRLAERAFIRGQYGSAEDLYTDVLVSRNNGLFRDKARYKRGWARLKQNFNREAIDDFVEVISMSGFDDLSRATEVERNNFEEYFRALGLSFVYMGGPESLHEYFRENPDFRYIPQTYFRVSDLYLAEQRYSDASGVLDQFNRNYPQSLDLPESSLKKVNVWVASGFYGNFARSLEEFYAAYHPQSSYWSKPGIRRESRADVLASLRGHILLASSRSHKEYQSGKSEAAYSTARAWYERYLKDYQAYSRKDNVHFLYAELLSQHGNHAEALTHYEHAAFDGEIIVNQDAAYAAILDGRQTPSALRPGPTSTGPASKGISRKAHQLLAAVRAPRPGQQARGRRHDARRRGGLP
ncbi:MAG: tetratricopeptide repeat protein [Chromatiales bacterium]|nr:tetratricopeptide repeat protein [Chromatiales bacterium]